MIVLQGKVTRQVAFNRILGQPLQCGRTFSLDMYDETPVSGKINSVFRHNDFAVEVSVKSDHSRITSFDYARKAEFP